MKMGIMLSLRITCNLFIFINQVDPRAYPLLAFFQMYSTILTWPHTTEEEKIALHLKSDH
jgi:hypothetical protein